MESDVPPILGRVINIEHNAKYVRKSSIRIHPNITSRNVGPYLLLQLIIATEQCTEVDQNCHWQINSAEIRLATRGIEQVAHTNCLIWIVASQIESLIAVFHSEDCVNHTFGAVSGRDDSYFTNSNCIIGDSNMTNLMLAYIPLGEYKIFGPGTRQSNPLFVAETEREVESKFAVMKGFMPKWSFLSMSNKLRAIESSLAPRSSDVYVSNKLQPILNGNLMLESMSLPNCITSITAKTSHELSAEKHYFPPMIGAGVKKRAPTSREVSEGNNQFALQQADTIHMVDINFSGFEQDEANSSWFPDDASQRHHYFKHFRNYIKFTYDDRLGEFRLTIKAMAIKI